MVQCISTHSTVYSCIIRFRSLSLSCAPGLVLAYHSACSQTHEPPALTASGLSFILSAPAGPATPHPPPAVSLSHPPLVSFHLYFPCPSNKSSAFILSVFVCFWVHTAKTFNFCLSSPSFVCSVFAPQCTVYICNPCNMTSVEHYLIYSG